MVPVARWVTSLASALPVLLVSTAAFAQRVATPSEPEPEPASDDDMPRVRGAALRSEVPDIDIQPWPPPLGLSLVLATRWPFQILGLGLGIEGYPTDWLRLSALYTPGMSQSRRSVVFSNYVEAFVGVRVLGVRSERSVDAMPDTGYVPFGQPRPEPLFKAWLPSYHALLVEAGGITGLFSLDRCVEDCAPRVGVEVPTCRKGCVSLGLEIGYLPMPATLMFQVGVI